MFSPHIASGRLEIGKVLRDHRTHWRGMRVNRCLLAVFCCLWLNSAVAAEFQPLAAEVSPGFSPEELGLEAGLWMEMEQIEKETRHSPRRVHEQPINAYLHGIVCRLARAHCNDIRVYLTRLPYFNAFMAPNGMMVVWTGLLLRTHNEAQLAFVLGHELGHYLRRHALDSFEDAKFKTGLMTLLSLGLGAAGWATGDSLYSDINQFSQLALTASLFAYERAMEREADQFGIQLMKEAGYDPFAAGQVWRTVLEEEKAAKYKKGQPSFFFAAHPHPAKRLETLDAYARILTAGVEDRGETARERFVTHMAPYWQTVIGDELQLNQLGKTTYLLDSLIANDVAPGVMLFYKGELYRLRKATGDRELAREQYEQAIQFESAPVDVWRSLGMLHLKEQRMSEAQKYFRLYLENAPGAEDREMIEFYLAME